MIVVTGAAGFIGSCLAGYLNSKGHNDLLLVDNLPGEDKQPNIADKKYGLYLERDEFIKRFPEFGVHIRCVFHLGARTDTTLTDKAIFDRWNVAYSQALWKLCVQYQVPFIYASSAATYGLGELGFSDDHALVPQLKPLNAYGESKQAFDLWVFKQQEQPPFWAGLKFFNVYGPNEYHKGRMASVIFHAYQQITATGKMSLFRSHRPDYADGGQLRDFIYVKDLLDTLNFLMEHTNIASGIYNLGTGRARTFLDLANATFLATGRQPDINFIDTPADIRDKYQYFTQAEMQKLYSAGYNRPFTSLEEGIADYVVNYLVPKKYL